MDFGLNDQDPSRAQPGYHSRGVAESPVSPRCDRQAPAPVLVGAVFTDRTRNVGGRIAVLWPVAAAGSHVLRRVLRRLAALSVQRHAACGPAGRRARFSPVYAHGLVKPFRTLPLLAYELPHRAPYVCGRSLLQSGQTARGDTPRLTRTAARTYCGVARYYCHRKETAGRSHVSVYTKITYSKGLVKE